MELEDVIKHALVISFFVFVMMVIVDFIDMASKKKLSEIMKGGKWRQYTAASFLGATPGCLGAFMNVSLYIHGMISFGAIVGGMIATSGDEAFVMLVQYPGTSLALFVLLFVAGIIFGRITDSFIKFTKFKPCETCLEANCTHCIDERDSRQTALRIFQGDNIIDNFRSFSFTRFLLLVIISTFLVFVSIGILGTTKWNWTRVTFVALSLCALYITLVVPEHYLHDHIWEHIIKRHLFRVFLWSFAALLFVRLGLKFWNLDALIHHHMAEVLVIAALLGIIPESGPHLIFVMMYSQELIPFSVLFTSSFVQDGHGMLPLLSYSLKDSAVIKLFNLIFGLAIGVTLFILGF